MQNTNSVIVKIIHPNKAKAEQLRDLANKFSQAVQLGLDTAKELNTSSRAQIHNAAYAPMRELGLPSDYVRMAVNATVSLARSFFKLRRKQGRPAFPRVNRNQGIGLGINAYAISQKDNRFILRVSTGKRGTYIWLPLSVPNKFRDRIENVKGDAKLFQKKGDWYAMLPVKSVPTGRSGERTFIGIDLGIVRHAVVATPDRVVFFNGKPARHRREHFADLRRRYQQHRRIDRVKAQRGKEQRWMRDLNNKISRQIVDLAAEYPNPVIVLEQLDGIRNRTKGSKRFNRMMSSWAFRGLVDMIRYKAAREGITAVFCDPRNTSKTCPKCGHATRSNRPNQGRFRCVSCGYQGNADMVAARNIAAAGPRALQQGPSDTARPNEGQIGDADPRPDGVKECAGV